jgi:hypothetical protein
MDNKIQAPIDPRELINHCEELRKAINGVPIHTPDFYRELRVTLADPKIKSCSYFGFSDFKVLEIMAEEQETRANANGCPKNEAFSLFVFSQISVITRWGKFSPELRGERLEKIDVVINDYPLPSNTYDWLKVRRSTVDIVFSSTPQTLGCSPEGSTLGSGYLIYKVNGNLPKFI